GGERRGAADREGPPRKGEPGAGVTRHVGRYPIGGALQPSKRCAAPATRQNSPPEPTSLLRPGCRPSQPSSIRSPTMVRRRLRSARPFSRAALAGALLILAG